MGTKGNHSAVIQAGLRESQLHPWQRPWPHQRGPEWEAQHCSPSPAASLEPREFPDECGTFPATPKELPWLIHQEKHHRCYVRNRFCRQRSAHQLPPAVQVLVAPQPPASCKGLAMELGEDRDDSAHAFSIPLRRTSARLHPASPAEIHPPGNAAQHPLGAALLTPSGLGAPGTLLLSAPMPLTRGSSDGLVSRFPLVALAHDLLSRQ